MIKLSDTARQFAFKAHGSQTYGDFPYMTHLEGVVSVLQEFGFTEDYLLAAGYLHDTLEDTGVNYGDLSKIFGNNIADIVYDVTDELGKNRKERHAKTYPKTAKNPQAVIVKLADRISNVRASAKSGDKLEMYHKEYTHFRQVLWTNNTATQKMWAELDRLLLA